MLGKMLVFYYICLENSRIMLRKLRIALASITALAAFLLFLDISGVLKGYLAFVAKIQFIPAILALNVGVIIAIVLVTLLFGRIYCSVICPLGIYQDAAARLNKKRNKQSFRPGRRMLRFTFLTLFIFALAAGLGALTAVLEPYSTFGLIVTNIFQPLYTLANNLGAKIAAHADSYLLYERAVYLKSLPALLTVLVLWIVVTILAFRTGRDYCNAICPVGTTLGFLSRFSAFKPVINTDKCINCGKCGRNCKGNCIDTKNHEIDYSRCVDCFNCLENCSVRAIKYQWTWKPQSKATNADAPQATSQPAEATSQPTKATADAQPTKAAPQQGRRTFLLATGLLAGAALHAQTKKLDGGFVDLVPKKAPRKTTPLTPAGSVSVKEFYDKCVSCHLCISACPNNVLRPSNTFDHLLQPEMSFDKGYCRPECTKCSEVCPSGSIIKITPEEKTQYKVGTAFVDNSKCLAACQGTTCGNCAKHCPVGAIRLVSTDGGPRIPVVIEERCIGCGACEYVCPVAPESAIQVHGCENHRRD